VNAPNAELKLKPGMFVRAVAKANVAAGGLIMDADMEGKWICPMHPDVVKDSAGDCDICGMPLVRTESLGFVGLNPKDADKPLVIPDSAPLITGTRAIVYVEVPGSEKPTYEGREIVLGPRAGDYYLVVHGLEEGERVVTRGGFKLDAELQIKAKPSMMTPEGGGEGGGAHAHGSPRPGEGESAQALPGLPVLVRAQLSDVAASARDAAKAAASGDAARAHSAFAALEEKIGGVEKEKLTGQASMLWKEYSMLLSNDCVEGKRFDTQSDLVHLADTVKRHVQSMGAKFGLSPREEAAKAPAVSKAFRNQFQHVLDAYLAMERALAEDDLDGARAAAQKARNALSRVDMKLLTGENHSVWMEHEAELEKLLSETTDAEDIEAFRRTFALLSEQMMATTRRFGHAGPGAVYQIKCPMAFNNRGATWLQDDDEVRNPYFGDAMLRCGEVIDVLPAADSKGGHADE
jgi:Cu(I)/Ag(I) efflux system membrane fusion protein